jgi:hypothetical protein
LRREVENRLLGNNPPDLSAASFLVWAAKKFQIDRNLHHIDHLTPLCAFNVKDKNQLNLANSPFNLRWLPIKDNLRKNNRLPNKEELERHQELVKDWLKESHYVMGLELNKFKTS